MVRLIKLKATKITGRPGARLRGGGRGRGTVRGGYTHIYIYIYISYIYACHMCCGLDPGRRLGIQYHALTAAPV